MARPPRRRAPLTEPARLDLRMTRAVLLPLLFGCGDYAPLHRGLFPVQVSLVIDLEDGARESLLLDLKRNHDDQLDLRVADGAVLHDGRRVWQVVQEGERVEVRDRVSGTRRVLPVRGSLLSWDRNHAWFGTQTAAGDVNAAPPQAMDCDLDGAGCTPGSPGELPLTHPGPADGFAITLQSGALRLRLPLDDTPEGEVLEHGVSRVVGVHWVKQVLASNRDHLDRIYRGRARLRARPRDVVLDGALEEWSGVAPLVVGASWHVEPEGRANWRGGDDASFSLAAAISAGKLCFAARVRDEHFDDADTLVLYLDGARAEVPMAHPSRAAEQVVATEWFGRTVERCVEAPATATLSFSAVYTDVDPDGTSQIASAPVLDGRGLGSVGW